MTMEDFLIPIFDRPADTSEYGSVPIARHHPLVEEPLVRLDDFGIAGESYYARTDGKNAPYRRPIPGALPELWCRRTVARKLVDVNARLAPFGFRLFVLDAYRPIVCQNGLWAFFAEEAARIMPDANPIERYTFIRRYVSDPSRFDEDNPRTWPSHVTGAAIDVILQDIASGTFPDMGLGFDEMSPLAHSDHFETLLLCGEVQMDDERLRNRRILYGAMHALGFINYPYEYWHFDWGNQMYVRNLRALAGEAPRAAWYGYIAPPAR